VTHSYVCFTTKFSFFFFFFSHEHLLLSSPEEEKKSKRINLNRNEKVVEGQKISFNHKVNAKLLLISSVLSEKQTNEP